MAEKATTRLDSGSARSYLLRMLRKRKSVTSRLLDVPVFARNRALDYVANSRRYKLSDELRYQLTQVVKGYTGHRDEDAARAGMEWMRAQGVSGLKDMIRHAAALAGYRIERNPATEHLPTYEHDNLTVHYKYVPFLDDPKFRAAYAAGSATEPLLQIEWRVAVICWAAQHGTKLEGDFVECGVNRGFFSRAVCEYVEFNALDKKFYLFDTFEGIPTEQMSDAESLKRSGQNAKNYPVYPECYEQTRATFARFRHAILVRGKVPEALSTVPIEKVAYLSIDMNIAYPERKAIEYFWPKLSSGAFVVLDDYGWRGYEEQRAAMDEFARSAGVEILALPTAQGLLIKP